MVNHNNRPITNNKEMSNVFNEFYSELGHNIEQKIPNSNKSFMSYLNSPTNHTFELTACSEPEILEIISSFGINKASGPNSIPTNLLKEFSEYLVKPLALIINKSLTEGTFPSILKTAHICPIYKKSDKTKCVNYRPISLLSNISKIFERIMYNRLESYLESQDIIFKHQFGFRKGYSTEHALMSITEQIKKNFNQTRQCIIGPTFISSKLG